MNVNLASYPAKGANENLIVDAPNNPNITNQFINYNLAP